jgi:N-acyl-D-amino-acid deacylase
VNARNARQYGRTPLLTAVASELEPAETVRLLLENGADPNASMTEGETPLDWALYRQDQAKVRVLEEYGATRGNGPRREDVASPEPGGIGDPRVSVTSGVARVLEAAPAVKEKFLCISCHHNALPGLAAAVAGRKGLAVDEALARRNVDDMLEFFASRSDRMMLGDPAVGGEALTAGYVQMALAAGGRPLDKITAVTARWLMARQMPDGRWLGNGLNRPPQEYSVISHTAVAAGGLRAYPLPGRADEVADSLRRAGRWLLAADAKSGEERAMRLMGLVWTGAPQSNVQAAIETIRREQAGSGGWSQFSSMEPDAYATGVSLYALYLAGVPPGDEAYRSGVAFLLRTQYQDGTWLVRTHSFPVQPAFESGFPFGRHQWISAAATSWASLAIAQTLPDVAGGR